MYLEALPCLMDVVDSDPNTAPEPRKAASHLGPQHLIKAMERVKDIALQEDRGWNEWLA